MQHRLRATNKDQDIVSDQNASQSRVRDVLDGLCEIIADLTDAKIVVVAQRNPIRNVIEVKGKYGTLLREVDMSFVLPQLNAESAPMLGIPDAKSDERFSDHPLLKLMPHIKSFMALLLPGWPLEQRAVLKVLNPRKQAFSDPAIWRELSHFALVCSNVLALEKEHVVSQGTTKSVGIPDVLQPLVKQMSESVTSGVSLQEVANNDQDTSSTFLFETLSKKRTLHSRKGVDFLTLRCWRGPLKPYQITALIALKKYKPQMFVEHVASEIVESIRQVYGDGIVKSVVPVPGGSSASLKSFSVVLAEAVAVKLRAEFCNVLEPQGKPGKSSPYKSASLKPYVVNGTCEGPCLLVDDVVSTGTHMELAINALRQHAKVVYGVAWICK